MATGTYFHHPRTQMLRFVPPGTAVLLDVGCGAGGFARALREGRPGRPLEIWGIEPDPAAAAAAREVLDRVLQGPAETLAADLPDGRFDCIVCNDVLEHFARPDLVLRELRRTLRPGGVVVASIPNVRHFFNVWDLAVRGDWSYQDEGIRDRTHLRFYTRRSMRALFAEAGYRVLRQEGINPTRSWRFRLANLLALGALREMRYLQFACVAEPAAPAAAARS